MDLLTAGAAAKQHHLPQPLLLLGRRATPNLQPNPADPYQDLGVVGVASSEETRPATQNWLSNRPDPRFVAPYLNTLYTRRGGRGGQLRAGVLHAAGGDRQLPPARIPRRPSIRE